MLDPIDRNHWSVPNRRQIRRDRVEGTLTSALAALVICAAVAMLGLTTFSIAVGVWNAAYDAGQP